MKPGPFGIERRRDRLVEELVAVGHVRHRRVVVEAAAAADDQVALAADVVGEAGARRDVVQVVDAGLVAEVARLAAVVDQDHRVGDARRVGGAPVGVVAHAEVDRQVVGHAPVVAEPQRQRRPRDVDQVVRVEVDVEPLQIRLEPADVPARRIVPGIRREAALELGVRRPRREHIGAAAVERPLLGVAHPQELGAELRRRGCPRASVTSTRLL